MSTKFAAIYARVSSPEQEEGVSLETQVEACITAARAQGYEVSHDLILKEVHSGADLWGRPMLSQIREWSRRGKIDAVFCYSIDRLTRDPTHLIILVEEFERFGVALELIQEPVDASPEGMLIQYVRGYAAKVEREKIKERTLRGKRAKLQGGKLIGAKPLYGYRLEEGRRVIVPEEARIVKMIFGWAVEGVPIREIARRLTIHGVPSPTGNVRWSKSTISRILRNEAYVGRTYAWRWKREGKTVRERPREEWIELPLGTTPPIVDSSVWEEAQVRLQRNKELSARRTKRIEDYLLRGYVFCGHCGKRMWAERRKRGENWELVYRCRGKAGHPDSTCERGTGLPCISVQQLDSCVWSHIKTILSDPHVIAQELARIKDDADIEKELGKIERLMRKTKREQENLAAAIEAADDQDVREFLLEKLRGKTASLMALEKERAALITKREDRQREKDQLDSVLEWCRTVSQRLGELTFQERRLALEALRVRVLVYRSGHEPRVELEVNVPIDAEGYLTQSC
jgi:site-specific DNA recombinase